MEATDQNTFSRKVFCNHHSSLCLAQILLRTEQTERMSTSQPDRLPGRTPLSAADNRWELWQGSSSLFPDNRRLLRPRLHPFQNASARDKLCVISHLQWENPKPVRFCAFSSLQKSSLRSSAAIPFACSEGDTAAFSLSRALCSLVLTEYLGEVLHRDITLFWICGPFINISGCLLLFKAIGKMISLPHCWLLHRWLFEIIAEYLDVSEVRLLVSLPACAHKTIWDRV